MPNIYAVIMAGGVGSRFWPKSRERSPKQFLDIVGDGSMIQHTMRRLSSLVSPLNTFVVTNVVHEELVRQELPFLPSQNVLVEPVGRNTAPCIGLAALWVHRIDPNGVMIVLPADHLIQKVEEFLRILNIAVEVADESRSLVTIGIAPTHPETGYGYIQIDETPEHNPYLGRGAYRVKTFAEKPNAETAEKFLASGDFLWNSGMFVWRADVILKEIAAQLPELSANLDELKPTLSTSTYRSALEQAYGKVKGISIDYGVMERAPNVYVVRGDFGWSDVGSWDEVARLAENSVEGNAAKGTVILRDVTGTYIDAGTKVVAAIGVEDLIIISTDSGVLVCKKGRSQEVKEIVDYLRRKQMHEHL